MGRAQGREVQVAHGVHELGRHELRIGAVELDRVEAARVLLLRELEQMDPVGLLLGHRVEQADHGVAVGIDEGEAAPGPQVVGGERHKLGALARAGPSSSTTWRSNRDSGTNTWRPASMPIGRRPAPGVTSGAATLRLRTTSTARSSVLRRGPRARPARRAEAHRRGWPPTLASIRQPAARSAPTAPTASNSQARTTQGVAGDATSVAVVEKVGPTTWLAEGGRGGGSGRDGRLRAESRSISPQPGRSSETVVR